MPSETESPTIKPIYAYVPKFIKYYLGEDPILKSVDTYLCSQPDDLSYVLDHLPELVVKAVGESGGYGMLIGPASDRATIQTFRDRIKADPRNYIAQPVIGLSRVPSYDPATQRMGARHVDFRPYCLYDGREGNDRPWRPHPRRTETRFAGSEFLAGWRQQRYLGSSRRELRDAIAHRRFAVLACSLHGARRGHRAHSRR